MSERGFFTRVTAQRQLAAALPGAPQRRATTPATAHAPARPEHAQASTHASKRRKRKTRKRALPRASAFICGPRLSSSAVRRSVSISARTAATSFALWDDVA
jgi:hypothetical protein